EKAELTHAECERLLQVKSAYAIINSLVAKEAILVFEPIMEKYTPKVENRVRLHPSFLEDKSSLEELFNRLSKRPKQEQILLKYLQQVPVYQQPGLNEKGLDKRSFAEAGLSASALSTLTKNGVLEEFKVIVSRFEAHDSSEEEIELADFQVEALSHIKQNFGEKQTVLLHGITGSGKTEIYIRLIQEVMESGSQVLLLL